MSMQNNGMPDGSSQPEPQSEGTPPERESPRPEPELPRWATRTSRSTSLGDHRLAAFIGPRWETTYRAKLARFLQDPAFTPTWNWAAAFGCPFWFLYRKLYLAFAAFYVLPALALPLLTGSPEPLTLQWAETEEGRRVMMMSMAIFISTRIAAGGTANWLLFRRARAATRVVSMQQLPEEAAVLLLQRIGGVNRLPTMLFIGVSAALLLAAALAPAA